MKYIYYGNELYHHGILGMEWGKRNGPPYPLGSSNHSASEKKAGWKKSLDGGSKTSTTKKKKSKYPEKLSATDSMTKTTKKVIDDYNSLSDNEFKARYHTSKKTYAKRVEKYGDPYAYRKAHPTEESFRYKALTRTGFLGSTSSSKKGQSYCKSHEKENVADTLNRLEKEGNSEKTSEYMNQISDKYTMVYDVSTGTYSVRPKT